LQVSYSSSESEDDEERFLRENRQATLLGATLTRAEGDEAEAADMIKYDTCPNCRYVLIDWVLYSFMDG
jgi:hypothetical protein